MALKPSRQQTAVGFKPRTFNTHASGWRTNKLTELPPSPTYVLSVRSTAPTTRLLFIEHIRSKVSGKPDLDLILI